MSQTDPLLPKHLDVEEAETANLESIERGRQQGLPPRSAAAAVKQDAVLKFKSGMRRALIAKQLSSTRLLATGHQRRKSAAQEILDHITPKEKEVSTRSARSDDGDLLFLAPLFGDTGSESDGDSSHVSYDVRDDDTSTRYGTNALGNRNQHTSNRAERSPAEYVLTWSMRAARRVLRKSIALWVALPLALAAIIFFYFLGNIHLAFMPGTARLSWWFNFAARQAVTLDLSRLTQYLLVDRLLLRTRLESVPLLTFIAFHSKGMPFITVAWGVWDLLLLNGDHRFQIHWLWFTEWSIYSSSASSGAYILTSELYLRILLSMILGGCVTAIKRCILEMRFGGRLFANFKPRLEQILKEIVLVTEVAALADEADNVLGAEAVDPASVHARSIKAQSLIGLAANQVRWSSSPSQQPNQPTPVKFTPTSEEKDTGSSNNRKPDLEGFPSPKACIEEFLDRWEDPIDKENPKMNTEAGVNDAVTFRRVLAHLEKRTPFGESFGKSSNRLETVESSQRLYKKLLKLSETTTTALPFDTLSVVACDSEETVDVDKLQVLRTVFRPDANDELSLMAFVSSIDVVYKRLRYFQASAANASRIDKVLEDTINAMFYFVLALVILVFLNFNPWAFLVSMTSLLVSLSFALGPSLSKWVEGILLIAVRRPFDIGDRIIISSAENLDFPGSSASWFVEDINLFTTTLRLARTNEVCSINNSSIAASRIVNCNRSPNSVIFLEKVAHAKILAGNNMERFKEALEKYVRDRPRIWDSLAFLRIENIDADLEQVKFSMAFRHRSSWQDAARILLNRSDLYRFVFDTMKDLSVGYDTPPARRLLYYGGVLEEGQVVDYKTNLLTPLNIRSNKGHPSAKSIDLDDYPDSLRRPMEGE